jgi:hypothetical protein
VNPDPFDSLRSRNPVPPGSLPDAPMAVASAITAGRSSLGRGLAIAAAAASVVLVAGGSWLLWSRGGTHRSGPVITPPTTTTAVPAETTTSLVAMEEAPVVVVYFLDADDQALVPVARDLNVLNVRPLPDLGPLALDLLLWGPGAWDAAPLPDPVAAAEAELTSAIPEDARLLDLAIAGGIATVDFSGLQGEFGFATPEALAQIVFTLTRMEGVTGVRFLIDGVPHAVVAETLTLIPTATLPVGGTLADPATRLTFEDMMGGAMIESPPLGGTLTLPATVSGVADPTDGRVGLILTDTGGKVLWESVVEASCGTPWSACGGERDWSTFAAAVPAGLVDYGRWGTLSVSLFDQGGNPYARRSYPVWLRPYVPFTDEPDIPEATTTSAGSEPGLGELRPFPPDRLTDCAAETARDLAVFEVALSEGERSLEELCTAVGPPDWETGSGLLIAVYDLTDGGQVWLGYAGPQDLAYARWVGPGGDERSLLGE